MYMTIDTYNKLILRTNLCSLVLIRSLRATLEIFAITDDVTITEWDQIQTETR